MFETATPELALNGPANVSPAEILASVAVEGAELRKGIDVATLALGSKLIISFKVNGKETDDMLLVTVHPQKGSAQGKIFKNPVTFTPGPLPRIAEAVKKYGQPTEIQLWSSEASKDLGLDGFVHWWGEVGVSASPDGVITHVLLRKVIERK